MNEMLKPFEKIRRFGDVIREVRQAGVNLDVVYDIGANDGRWTRECKQFLPLATYYLFEANPAINLSSEHSHFFNAVLSDEDGKRVKYHLADPGKENTGNSYYKEMTGNYTSGKYVELTTKTLKSIAQENSLLKPDLVKIDTQGSEVDIINGCALPGTNFLSSASIMMLEVPIMPYNDGAPGFTEYIETMYNIGYVPTGVDHIAIRKGILNQLDVIFVKSDLNQEIHNHRARYKGFV